MELKLKYVPALRAYTTVHVEHSHRIKAITNELFAGDFWKKGSMYVKAEDLDVFMEAAMEHYTVSLQNS